MFSVSVTLFSFFLSFLFFFYAPATTEIYTLSLHDALPILDRSIRPRAMASACLRFFAVAAPNPSLRGRHDAVHARVGDGLADRRAKVPGDGDEGTAPGGLTVEHFLRLVGGGVMSVRPRPPRGDRKSVV